MEIEFEKNCKRMEKDHCSTEFKEECKYEEVEECSQEYKKECKLDAEDLCQMVPVKECHPVKVQGVPEKMVTRLFEISLR